ncbi:hypothetical protein M501DRAFT_922243, partial [Patellaria atrata CBS 101060]
DAAPNSLLSTARASDTSPEIQLHPLVLLTISDFITRHTLRRLNGPVVGAILGKQNGREITMEVAFECLVTTAPEGEIRLNCTWFDQRLEQFKDVYKGLDLVGWFTLGPSSGPQPHHLPIHANLQEVYNESIILMLFHPTTVLQGNMSGGKMPLTLYESSWETGGAMEVEGEAPARQLKFKELVFSIETGEAEMIAVDFVARGGGNATAVTKTETPAESQEVDKGKGKAKAVEEGTQVNGASEIGDGLSPEDEEVLASITAKSNAIRMLQTRIHLLQSYLSSLPPSYLTDPSLPFTSSTSTENPATSTSSSPIDHPLLRALLSLTRRLPLLVPPNTETFANETRAQKSDTALVSLLEAVTTSAADAREFGRKHAIIEIAK